ncbi:MAG: cytochrome c oxidase assembly protein [Acidimicrobiia bacterium]
MLLADVATNPAPWRYQLHPEVWLLVATVVGSYVYAVKRIGPHVVPSGEAIVTRAQKRWFAAAVLVLWGASDWPVHDIAEEYLYSVHMFQHMALSYFLPPMVMLATPTWLARLIIGSGRSERALRWCCKPVVAGVAFNAVIMITHIPGIVNASVSNGPLHYLMHVLVVTTGLALWMSICGPIPEWRIGPAATMIYLFLNSVVPTVPAGWLTFAEGVVYKHYTSPVRVWGLSPTYDQQLAGVVMKVGGSVFLWAVVVVLWIRHFARSFNADQGYRRYVPPALEEDKLTFEDVANVFDSTEPPPEPQPQAN